MRIILFAVYLLACLCLEEAAAFELKGMSPGMSEAELGERFPGLVCKKDVDDQTVTNCRYSEVSPRTIAELKTLAEVPVMWWSMRLYDDKLGLILAATASDRFPTLEAAMVAKFGKSRQKRSALKSRMGVEFQQILHEWRDPTGNLALERYGLDLSMSMVTYAAPWFVERDKIAGERAGKKKAGDL